jgi:hypothetical protein
MLIAIPKSILSIIITINNKREYSKNEAKKCMNFECDLFIYGILSNKEFCSNRLNEITKYRIVKKHINPYRTKCSPFISATNA